MQRHVAASAAQPSLLLLLLLLLLRLCLLPVWTGATCQPATLRYCTCTSSQDTLDVDCSHSGFNRTPSDIPYETTSLNLDSNNIRVLRNNDFERLSLLKALSVRNNQLRRVDTGAFNKLNNLQELNLYGNELLNNTAFPKSVFDPLKNSLLTLDLRRNLMATNMSIMKYPLEISGLSKLQTLKLDCLSNELLPQSYSYLRSLKSLIFSGGRPHCFVISSAFLSSLSDVNISEVDFEGLAIGQLPFDLFENFTYLSTLNLSNNPLIGKNIVQIAGTLNKSAITTLVLNNTGISIFVDKIITNLCGSSIKNLYLDRNTIYSIEHDLHICLKKLEMLSLAENTFINNSSFFLDLYQMKNIVGVNISSQQLESTYLGGWHHTARDSHICMMDMACPLVFPKTLTWIDMSRNGYHLPYVPEFVFMSNTSLKSVYLSFSGLQKLDKPIYCLSHVVTRIEEVWFNDNQIRCINASFFNFCDWSSLNKLRLGNNRFGIVSENICNKNQADTLGFLRPLWNLTYLELTGCSIDSDTMNDTVFQTLTELKHLDVSRNDINKLSFLFQHMKNIELIDLSYNNIQCLSKSVTRTLDQMQMNRTTPKPIQINLEGNLLSCNCECLDFLTWIRQTKVHVLKNSTYQCIFNDGQIMSLENLSNVKARLEAQCYKRDWLYILIGTSWSGYLLIIGITLIIRFRHDIKYIIIKREMNTDKMSLVMRHIKFRYHGFIACHASDIRFVRRGFLHNLETKETGMQFIIPHRNFPVGGWSIETMSNAITLSDKSIYIISQDFLNDQVCKEQLAVAHQVALDRGKQTIIFILMPGIDTRQLPGTIRLIARTATCLRWPQGAGARRLFWLILHRAILEGDQLRNTPVKELV